MNFRQRISLFYQQFRLYIHNFNLFPAIPPSTDQHELRTQRISTRLFLILLIISILILLSYFSFLPVTKTIHVKTPTLDQYLQLYSSYANTLNCPCSTISIRYDEFLKIKYTFHQVCNSVFVTDGWIHDVGSTPSERLFPKDFRRIVLPSLRGMQSLCQIVNATVDNRIAELYSNQYVTAVLLPMELFKSQVDSFVDQFRSLSTSNLLLSLILISKINQANALLSASQTNSFFSIIDSFILNNYAMYDGCSCGVSSRCSSEVSIYDYPYTAPVLNVTGFRIGCYIVEALLQSDLRCFYHHSCLDQLLTYLTPNSDLNITVLDPLLSKNYRPNSTFEEILGKLMIEEWNVTQMYDRYYNACQVVDCSYNIETRNDAIYTVTTLIGIVGGLTTILKLVVVHLVKFIRRKRNVPNPNPRKYSLKSII